MRDIIRIISLISIMVVMSITTMFAEVFVGDPAVKKNKDQKANVADCVPAAGSSYLSVNNVRAYIETSGSMWFRRVAEYFVPKEGQASSMFAAALWIGGRDVAGQLKLAAITFRQRGNDFWPGPLRLSDATISQTTCSKYDMHFFMSKKMAIEHKERMAKGDPDYTIPPEIKNWPGNPKGETAGSNGRSISGDQSWYLAPYVDVDGDGTYSPDKGDYPYYDFTNELCPWTAENRARAARGELPKTEETKQHISSGGIMADQVLKGDETLWWVLNDKGSQHKESKGDPIGLEIRAQAFGFATTDELNNMTFYSYEIINRSSYALTETYFSQWVDPDLGDAKDDYVGCDVERGLGYCYNGVDPDGTGLPQHYGAHPPAVGVDFFQGPYLDPDGYDNPSYNKKEDDNVFGPSFNANYANRCEIVTQNGVLGTFTWDSTGKGDMVTKQVIIRAEAINGVNFGDGIVDNERFGMRRFVYHDNDHSERGDPTTAVEFYNLLRGIWRDNTRMRFGKNGHVGKTGTGAPEADFMFPGASDPCNWGTKGQPVSEVWTEENVKNPPYDRRFMQSAGPFTLKKGAINYITVGIPWARANGTPWASVELLKIADDKAQILFESCFKVIDGPDAPDLVFREMDKRLICYIVNPKGSNNEKEDYCERDPSIPMYRVKEVIKMEPIWIQIPIDTVRSVGKDTVYKRNDTTFVVLKDTLIRYVNSFATMAVKSFDTIRYQNDNPQLDKRYYRFEGYQVYQLVNALVGPDELSDPSKAQLVFQCDIKNGIKQIINYEYNAVVATEVPVEKVNGRDEGISHSFEIKEDKFGGALVNYKKYYYLAIAYAHNSYEKYTTSSDNPDGLFGQKKPYLMGNKNIGDGGNGKPYAAIPHIPYMEERGIITQSNYGDQPQITQLEGQGNGGLNVKLEQKTIDEILKYNKADSLVFKRNYGPINVKIVDPLKVVASDFTLRFYNPKYIDSLHIKEYRDSLPQILHIPSETDFSVNKNTYWKLEYTDADTVVVIYSDTSISVLNEQFLLKLGLSLTIFDARFTPLEDFINEENSNAYRLYCGVNFISDTMEFTNSKSQWIASVPQTDGSDARNWVRSGTTLDGDWTLDNQTHEQIRRESYYYKFEEGGKADPGIIKKEEKGRSMYRVFHDKGKQFGNVVRGGTMTWAPYALASVYDNNPGAGYERREKNLNPQDIIRWDNGQKDQMPLMSEIYSVDIILTSDKNLWTRCPVVEISDDTIFSTSGAVRHDIRKSPSVGKDGKPDGTGTGMSWFPGYAICVETGERLNMMFGENSSFPLHNGADMIFNPTSAVSDASGFVMGGGHYIYVMGHRDLFSWDRLTYNVSEVLSRVPRYICPAYDEGKWLKSMFDEIKNNPAEGQRAKHYIYKNVLWTTMPLANGYWLEPGNDVKISLRVSRPYQRWSSVRNIGVSNPQNNNMPMYKFSTKGMEALTNQRNIAESYMDSIYVVPNPYYGTSRLFESSQLDTRVKFVNLPVTCMIKIFTMDGTLVKSISKDDGFTYVEWDLKNEAKIPISSGMYLIHIQEIYKESGVAKNGKEKTLKFLCIQRPVDVNAF